MVQRQPNGDLTWVQDDVIMQVSKEQPEQYNPALETEDLQINAAHENSKNRNAYMNEVAIAQVNVDASRPIPGIPVKPEYITVTDPNKQGTTVTPGVASKGPWPEPPGLPELKHKIVYPSGKGPTEEPFIIEPPPTEAKPAAEQKSAEEPPPAQPHRKR